MFIQIGNCKSKIVTTNIGVPQGSILGPWLYIMYVNDLPNFTNEPNVIMYADDTTVYVTGDNLKYVETRMNEQLNLLNNWFLCNRLSLNVGKTNYVIFRKKKEAKIQLNNIGIRIGAQEIERKSVVKFLGIHIDEFLNWDTHITSLSVTLSKSLYIISKAKQLFKNKKILLMLYYAIFHSHVCYGIHLWSFAPAYKIKRIKSLQKRAVRIIHNVKNRHPSAPLFKQSNVLPIEKI